jgi:hypothetical protein
VHIPVVKQRAMVKKANPLAARIKRLMQKDEEVGKIAQATPFLIGTQPPAWQY